MVALWFFALLHMICPGTVLMATYHDVWGPDGLITIYIPDNTSYTTPTPSKSPTNAPTDKPTSSPSTTLPSSSPTKTPTLRPTTNPSKTVSIETKKRRRNKTRGMTQSKATSSVRIQSQRSDPSSMPPTNPPTHRPKRRTTKIGSTQSKSGEIGSSQRSPSPSPTPLESKKKILESLKHRDKANKHQPQTLQVRNSHISVPSTTNTPPSPSPQTPR